MTKVAVANWSELADRVPAYALVANVDLVVIRYGDKASVLYGRCHHRGALLADGFVDGDNLICGLHNWDYRIDTGISEYNNTEALPKFTCWIEDGKILVDQDEIAAWALSHPQPYRRDAYQGLYADVHGDPVEPHVGLIQRYANDGLTKTGHHGVVEAMGVPRGELPSWDDIQIVTAQLATPPQLDDAPVGTEVVIGPNAQKPLTLKIPLLVSDMSFGSLSEPAKVALAKGAELAGTGICSGEGGMLAEEQAANSRYFYELASARFGFSWDKVCKAQAFHFKGGQAAKTGTGGHLPGKKVIGKIAVTRGLPEGQDAVSPARFPEWTELSQFRDFAAEVRDRTGGIPIGYKLSAQHIEKDIDAALEIGCDYIILDGRGGGDGCGARHLPQQHFGADDSGFGARAATSRQERAERHADHHRRIAATGRFRQGAGARRGCRRACQFGDPGDRLPRHARLPHQQLPGRHRHPEAASDGAARRGEIGATARALLRDLGRADEDPGARLRPHPSQSAFARRPCHLEEDMARLSGVPYGGVGNV